MLIMIVIVMMLVFVVIMVMMLMFFVIVVMMMVFMFILVVMVMFMVMVVMVLMLVVIVIMVVVMVMMGMLFRLEECGGHSIGGDGVLDGFADLRAREVFPRCGDDLGMIVDSADQVDGGIQLVLCDVACSRQDDGAGVLDLILVELLKVLQVDLALAGVDDGNGAADFGALDLLDRCNDIGEFADAGGLDEDTVRGELLDDFLQRGAEVTHEGAADAAGVHFCDLDAGFLEETAVDTDLSELVLDEDEFLSLISVGDEFLDERGFTCA